MDLQLTTKANEALAAATRAAAAHGQSPGNSRILADAPIES